MADFVFMPCGKPHGDAAVHVEIITRGQPDRETTVRAFLEKLAEAPERPPPIVEVEDGCLYVSIDLRGDDWLTFRLSLDPQTLDDNCHVHVQPEEQDP